MKRGLLVIALGIAFLIVMVWLGTFVTEILPHHSTPQTQSLQTGPYDVTLRVNPNPASIETPTSLTIQVRLHANTQPVSDARVVVVSNMESMDMGTEQVNARSLNDGSYLAIVHFSMSGLWQAQIIISSPGEPTTTALFEINAQ